MNKYLILLLIFAKFTFADDSSVCHDIPNGRFCISSKINASQATVGPITESNDEPESNDQPNTNPNL